LLQALYATGKPVVYVQMSGSAIASVWEAEHLPAIVQAWYPGEAGGIAVADVLFGDYNPAGRLPVTFYASTADLPPFTDYATKERTYRYFTGTPLYPFGHGLSYTQFTYTNLRVAQEAPATISVHCTVKNTGERAGDEVVQVYVRHVGVTPGDPLRQLCAFERIPLASGESRTLSFAIPTERFSRWIEERTRFEVFPGTYVFEAGASSEDIRLTNYIHVLVPG
jgi:beta-glucosidase